MSRILIVKTGETATAVRDAHGDYERWFIDAMGRPHLSFVICDATKCAIPGMDGFAGAVVTGSVSAVYRGEPWMPALSEFLRGAERHGVPVLCVCFGAQLLAQARRGRVNLNPEGWEIGSVDIDLTAAGIEDPLCTGLPRTFSALATHEDRIERTPPGGVVLASNANSPVQAFRVAERVWGVQFHPEATIPIIEKLIELRAETLTRDALEHGLPVDDRVDRLLDTLRRPDAHQARNVLDNFVRICLAG